MTDFCQAIATGSVPEYSSTLGVEVVRMIEAVDLSFARNGSRVAVADQAGVLAA